MHQDCGTREVRTQKVEKKKKKKKKEFSPHFKNAKDVEQDVPKVAQVFFVQANIKA